ncbi:MAG: hypothetical protein K6356_12350 [Chloroflexus sp.]
MVELAVFLKPDAARQWLREWGKDGQDKARPCAAHVELAACFPALLRWGVQWWQNRTTVPFASDAVAHQNRVVAVGALAGAVGGMALAPVLQRLQGAIPQLPLHLPTLPPDLLAPVLVVLCALAGLLTVLSLSTRQRAARGRDRLATLRAHAHHPVWPDYRWTLFPAPGKQRTILSPYELAAFWHPPSLELEAQFA